MAEAGKKPHGNKKYYHVLIDINRGELFDDYIRTKLKIKPTSWIREVVYKFLQDKIDKEVYDEALRKDQENWNRAIQNRLQGRALSRILNSIKKKMSDSKKLRKLKEIRRKDLEKNLLDVELKGYDHYVFINKRNKAQVVSKQGGWVTEHIRTAILKFNYEIDKTDGMLVKDFEKKYLNEYEKIFSKDS